MKTAIDNIEKERQRLLDEAKVLLALRHENLVNCFRVISSADHLFVLIEYMDGGTLHEFIENFPKEHNAPAYSEEFCKYTLYQIAKGLEHMHKKNVLHRDIKAANILLSANGQVKIADFGFSKRYAEGSVRDTQLGTIAYWAPEILMGDP